MIRPAEKYLRSLFGMDQGIASVGSYDSGKQTFDAMKKVAMTMAKVVGGAALTVATGGAGAGVAGKMMAKEVGKKALQKGASEVAEKLRSW